MTNPGVDLGNGITVTCDGYIIKLMQEAGAGPNAFGRQQHIILGAPSLHALIAFAKDRGLLEG